MALGYCMTCGKLTSIRKKGVGNWDGTEAWYPVPHHPPGNENSPESRLCSGAGRQIK